MPLDMTSTTAASPSILPGDGLMNQSNGNHNSYIVPVAELTKRDVMIANLRHEMDHRISVMKKRQKHVAHGLRTKIEMRINRVPRKFWDISLGELMQRALEYEQEREQRAQGESDGYIKKVSEVKENTPMEKASVTKSIPRRENPQLKSTGTPCDIGEGGPFTPVRSKARKLATLTPTKHRSKSTITMVEAMAIDGSPMIKTDNSLHSKGNNNKNNNTGLSSSLLSTTASSAAKWNLRSVTPTTPGAKNTSSGSSLNLSTTPVKKPKKRGRPRKSQVALLKASRLKAEKERK